MKINWQCKKFTELTTADLYDILAVRQQVFIAEQNCNYCDLDYLDQKSWHLLGREEQGALVAYSRILPPGVKYTETAFGRVLITKEFRSYGFGKELVERSVNLALQEYPDHNIKISAQLYLQKFYESYGFKVTGGVYDDGGIEHIDMIRDF